MAVTKAGKKASPKKKILVIVESPAKAKTIEKYLGSKYVVKASVGHLIDLPKSRIAIDVANGFEPEYITVRGRAKLLKELQSEAKKSSAVYLASDNDREGEAIAFHLGRAIQEKAPGVPIKRIVFNEITPVAIKQAVASPGDIELNKVYAQKARRVLDRLVGYNLSPLLWKKVKNGLSAGRVQSVALRLICEREVEVENFVSEEYWTVDARFKKGRAQFEAQLNLWKGEKPVLKNEKEVQVIVEALKDKEATIGDIRQSEKTIKPKPPFTTSKLQQTAANRLGFTSKKTMQIAQQLYEGVNIGSSRLGLISYMRTDSVRVSPVALEEVRQWIGENHPAELPKNAVEYRQGKKAQDAHEAIRPTYVAHTPESLKEKLTRDQFRLYSLIWEAFVASQMNPALSRTSRFDIRVGEAQFRATGSRLIEKGFYKVIKLLSSKEEREKSLPILEIGEILEMDNLRGEQHFTQGPARYTDASIVKVLEEKGIGRPSTYAPIISVLLERYYVSRTNRQLQPTLLGRLINEMLVEYFPSIVDASFTASMEDKLDSIEENNIAWQDMIGEFYLPFEKRVSEVSKTLESFKGSLDEPTDYVCEKCGRPMVKKLGRFGYFLACSGFPECRSTRSIPLAACPRPGCGGEIVARKTKGRGKEFYGCTNFPECDFISHFKPIDKSCPDCGWFLVEKYDKKNGSQQVCINTECSWNNTEEEQTAAEDEANED